MTAGKQRDYSYDVMKGIAIYAVVMGHVLLFASEGLYNTLLFKVITISHMPLFFFISGYFSYKERDGRGFVAPELWARLKQLIVPMVVMSALFALFRSITPWVSEPIPHDSLWTNLSDLWLDNAKWGYWFTVCLFEIIVIYRLLTPLMRRASRGAALWCIIVSVFIALIVIYKIVPKTVGDVLELKFVAMYTPVFLVGVLARRYSEGFYRLLHNQWATTAALLCGAMMLVLLVYQDQIAFMLKPGITLLLSPVWHLFLVVVAFSVIRSWVVDDQGHQQLTPSIRLWAYLGRNSLGIYLLQYFFLFPIPWLTAAIESMGLQLVPSLTASFVASGLIVAACCGAIAFLRTSSYAAFLTLGDPIKR